MSKIGRIIIDPPLLNSASPWASDLDDLQALYDTPYTGAVTTRTSTLKGFADDPAIHQVAFTSESITSLNSYGYSPCRLSTYLDWVREILSSNPDSSKPFIISITSSADHGVEESFGESHELSQMITAIQELRKSIDDMTPEKQSRIAVEINTSCPNIKDAPPPAYQPENLRPLLSVVAAAVRDDPTLTVGLKLPPYVYQTQFTDMIRFISSFTRDDRAKRTNPISFFTCTNTLGSSLLFNSQTTNDQGEQTFAVPSKYGGLAGEALHPLALGNVHMFSELLRESDDAALQGIAIIGVGGVVSPEGVARMFRAGASAVACATILGRKGVDVYSELVKGVEIGH